MIRHVWSLPKTLNSLLLLDYRSCCRAVVGALNAFPDSRAVALRGAPLFIKCFCKYYAHMTLYYVGLDALFRLAHDEANQTQLGAAGAVSA